MRRTALSLLWTLAAAGAVAPLGAQSLKEAFSLVPRSALQVEVYKDAETLEARVMGGIAPMMPASAPAPGIVDVYTELGLVPGARAAGSVVHCEFPAKAVKAPQEPRTAAKIRSADWVPVKDFAAFSRKLGAVKTGGLLKVKRDAGIYFMARSGHYALVSKDAALIREIQGKSERLGAEMAPLLPWIASHDLVVLATSASVKASLGTLRAGLDKNSDPGFKALKPLLGPALETIVGSVDHAGIGVDFPADHSIRFQARAFFAPGSPLAKAGASRPEVLGHPMEGLSPAGFVIAMGGPMPRSLGSMAASLTTSALLSLAPEEAAKMAELQKGLYSNVQSQAFTLGIPAAGAPLLSGLRWQARVGDPAAYFKAMLEMKDLSAPFMAKAGIRSELQKDVLPGVPSLSNVISLDGLASALPGQMKGLMASLLGGENRVTFTVGQVDEHTLVGVMGDASALKAAMASAGPGFGQDPGVMAVDALLPQLAPWKMYLNVQNSVALGRIILNGFMPDKAKALPAMAPVPPVGFSVRMDSLGLEFGGAATPETLAALGAFAREMQARPGAPETAAEVEAETEMEPEAEAGDE